MNETLVGETGSQLAARRRWRQVLSTVLGKSSVLPILIPLWIAFTVLAPAFGTARNVRALLAGTAVVFVAAIGETFVLLTGGIDLSVSTVVACSAVVAAHTMGTEGDWLTGLLVCLGIGIAFGLVNGFSVSWLGLTPFVFTLGTNLVARGIAFTVSEGIAIRVPKAIRLFGRTDWLGLPATAVIAIGLLILFQFLLSQTSWGRYVCLFGANRTAARYVGLQHRLVEGSVYLLTGFLGGLAGFLSLANLGAAIPGVGDTILLTIIGGVILGGTSMFGGEGSVWRTAVGVLLLAALTNGLNLLGFDFYDQLIAQGIVIILGTALTVRFGQERRA
ncbi:MAG: ABC transporter permease [Anaerolineae bacterium]|nr:ABC transporter permease [Anaerolineae bacterium]